MYINPRYIWSFNSFADEIQYPIDGVSSRKVSIWDRMSKSVERSIIVSDSFSWEHFVCNVSISDTSTANTRSVKIHSRKWALP